MLHTRSIVSVKEDLIMSLEEILELGSGCEVKLNGPDVFVGVYHSAWSHQRSLVLYFKISYAPLAVQTCS